MLIMRKIPLDVPVKELTVGDEILIRTKSFGSQILDVVRDDERGLLLMFEDCVMESAINEGDTNKGGFGSNSDPNFPTSSRTALSSCRFRPMA